MAFQEELPNDIKVEALSAIIWQGTSPMINLRRAKCRLICEEVRRRGSLENARRVVVRLRYRRNESGFFATKAQWSTKRQPKHEDCEFARASKTVLAIPKHK